MKRVVILAMVLALALCLTAGAQAAAFPPKSYCFDTDSGAYGMLTFKSLGSLPTSEGSVNQYQITGSFTFYEYDCDDYYSFPVHGAGYIDYNGDFHFTLSGTFWDYCYADQEALSLEGYIFRNLGGWAEVYIGYPGGSYDSYLGDFRVGNCADWYIPYNAKSKEAVKAQTSGKPQRTKK